MAPDRAEIVVLSSGGLKSALLEIAGQFEHVTGHALAVSFGPANVLKDRIDGGQPFDVAILTPAQIDDLVQRGTIAAGSATAVARAGVGLAVRAGAAHPDIGSVASFTRALTAARCVAYTTAGQSGVHFARVLDRLGIAAEVNKRARTIPGGAAGELVARGEAEMAVQLIPELMAVSGIEVVGPFPPQLQNYVVLTAGIGTRAGNVEAAQALIAFLTAAAAASVIKAKGLEPA